MNGSLDFHPKRVLIVALLLVFFAVATGVEAFAQRGTRDRIGTSGNVLWGDLKIEGAPADGVYQVILLAGPNELAKTTIGSGGRYKFSGIPNGDYELVVEFENQIIYRNRMHLAESQPTDVRSDILLEAKASNPPANDSRGAVVPATFAYNRSASNQALYDKALASVRKKDTAQAISSLKQLVTNDPKDFVAWAELGTLYFKENSFPESEDAYLRALEAKPGFILALLNLGKLALAQKKFDVAVDVLTRAVAAAPESADAQQYLGEAYLGLKKGSKALGPLNEALRLDPKGKADIHLRLAALYNGAGMKDKAAAEYEQFLVKRPDHPEKAKLQEYIKQNKKP